MVSNCASSPFCCPRPFSIPSTKERIAAFPYWYHRIELLGGVVTPGWAPVNRQVGLTGKVVSPDVYIALGISGASQHLAGIGGAKAVVAVNTDADAPIFASARFGVVMDCHTFAASLIEQLRSAH